MTSRMQKSSREAEKCRGWKAPAVTDNNRFAGSKPRSARKVRRGKLVGVLMYVSEHTVVCMGVIEQSRLNSDSGQMLP